MIFALNRRNRVSCRSQGGCGNCHGSLGKQDRWLDPSRTVSRGVARMACGLFPRSFPSFPDAAPARALRLHGHDGEYGAGDGIFINCKDDSSIDGHLEVLVTCYPCLTMVSTWSSARWIAPSGWQAVAPLHGVFVHETVIVALTALGTTIKGSYEKPGLHQVLVYNTDARFAPRHVGFSRGKIMLFRYLRCLNWSDMALRMDVLCIQVL